MALTNTKEKVCIGISATNNCLFKQLIKSLSFIPLRK
jgi:hypothetical protein